MAWLSRTQNIQLSYAEHTCVNDIMPLPDLFKDRSNPTYEISNANKFQIGSLSLFARQTCIQIKKVPSENVNTKLGLAFLNLGLLEKKYSINSGTHPQLSREVAENMISVKEPLIFSLDKVDVVFSYQINIGGQTVRCENKNQQISCPVEGLGLKQGTEYTSVVEKYFKTEKIADLLSQQVRTVEPVVVEKTSFKKIIYDKPEQFKIVANKNLSDVALDFIQIQNNGERKNVSFKYNLEGNSIILKPDSPLDRNSEFEVILNNATAVDKGILRAAHKISFRMSGGPKVSGINIGTRSVSPGSSIVITFDQPLKPNQNFNKILRLSSAGKPLLFKLNTSSRSVTIRPTAHQPLCSKFDISLNGKISNKYDVSGSESWSHSSRIVCYTVHTIGYSAQGKAINAWRFGSGTKKILYLGGTHGNEKSSKYLMDRWISELDNHPDKIPTNRTIVIIPNLNPDGFASSSRRNAHNVDLNRNFPASNWKADVTMPGGQLVKNGGGKKPLSEPESIALANYVKNQGFNLVLSYHAVASLVTPNQTSKAAQFAKIYSQFSGYRYLPFSQLADAFHYDTTGAFEDWAAEKLGMAVFVVELGSMSYSQFERNQDALWKMISEL